MKRNRIISGHLHVFDNFPICRINGIGFRGRSEVHDTLSQRELAFRQSEKLKRFLAVQRDTQGIGICQSYIFRRKPHEPSSRRLISFSNPRSFGS